jgi:hypothetical protein
MNDSHSREILTRSLDILQNVRQRPEMYLRQVTPEGVEAWLGGFQVGLFTAGVRSSGYGLRGACERRGIPFTTTVDLIGALAGQGHADKGDVLAAVMRELNLSDPPRPDDAADALAVALTGWFQR